MGNPAGGRSLHLLGQPNVAAAAPPGVARDDPLRVLLVSGQFPFPPTWGFATRVHQLARQVASRHDLTLLSYGEPDDDWAVDRSARQFDVRIVPWRPPSTAAKRTAQVSSALSRRPYQSRFTYSQQMQRAIGELCATGQFDVVQVETSMLCTFDFPSHLPLIIDEHNIEYEVLQRVHQAERSVLRRSFSDLEYRRFRRFEQTWWRRAAACVLTSSREEAIVHWEAPLTPTEVVPNGVDLDYFSPRHPSTEPDTVLFNGALNYRPNLDAAYHLVDEIWPRVLEACPGATLTIVGRGAEAELRRLRRPQVLVTGEVPDVRPYLEKAAVVAVPIRMGGGTRLKVLEALAMAKPVVSTKLGCEGVNVRHGRHLCIEDDPAPFAAAITALFADRTAATALGRAGRVLMEQEYSWDLAGRRLDRLYRRVLSSRAVASIGSRTWSHPGEGS
jgi:glycosyltransferase involved in cell wall biosynthesis